MHDILTILAGGWITFVIIICFVCATIWVFGFAAGVIVGLFLWFLVAVYAGSVWGLLGAAFVVGIPAIAVYIFLKYIDPDTNLVKSPPDYPRF